MVWLECSGPGDAGIVRRVEIPARCDHCVVGLDVGVYEELADVRVLVDGGGENGVIGGQQ